MTLGTRATLVVVIGTILGLGISVGGSLLEEQRRPPSDAEKWERHARFLAEVMERVKEDYVEPIDEAALMESAVRGMVADLDRHSAYLDADEYQEIRISTSGRYTGVGLEVSLADGRLVVVSPIDDSPAARAGVEAGDQILEIDEVTVTEESLDDTVERLRGRAGTTVSIVVQRSGYDDPLSFDLTRRNIQVGSVRHELINGDIGYLRLSQFIDSTSTDAGDAIRELHSAAETAGQDLRGLVLDLRNNPGGVLNSAVDVSDLFLDGGVIVTAEGRSDDARFRRDASEGDILDGLTMVILVNGGSASGSEIVAGALQDHGRATVVGTRTFGKGLVQTVVPLSRGRAIKLTTSKYFTPSGDSINEIGIAPDVYVEAPRGLVNPGLSGSLDRERDTQLIEALDIIRDRPVMHSRAPD